MTTLKRMFAGLVSLIMVFSIFSVMPVMATGEETETETIEFADIFEQARYETNLVVNPGLEDDDVVKVEGEGENKKVTEYYRTRFGTTGVEFKRSSKESYNGDYSILSIKRSGGGDFPIPWVTEIRKDATYIASVMALGTVANKTHWDASAGKNETWGSKFVLTPAANNSQGAAVASGVITSGTSVQNITVSKIDYTMTAAASSDLEAERAAQSDWKRFYTTVQVNNSYPDIASLGVGLNIQFQGANLTTEEQKYLEVYTDDYYLAELMVADVQCTTPTTLNVPVYGSTTVDLTAVAYNQLETTDGLTDADYIWEIPTPVAGISIENNKLTVTSETMADEVTVRVTCVPKFIGADSQAEKYTKYRTKDITFKISDCYESLRNGTGAGKNLISANHNFDLEGDTLWGSDTYSNLCYFTPSYQRKETYTISPNQAYNGEQSLSINRPEGAYLNESYFPRYTSIMYGKTLIASAMILGTEANAATCETNPEASAALKIGTYNTTYFNTLPEQFVLPGNTVKLNSMLENSSSEKASKDKWQMVHTGMAIASASEYGSRYWTGAGVVLNGANIELFADDYYIGELIVAKVKGTTEKAYITSEENTVELTAETYNQLGTTDYFGENTTYAWNAESLPEGVQLVDGKLVIAPTAKEGQAVLTVTVTPDFMGAEAQTAEQKAYRTATVTVDIVDQTRFTFAEADGKITATAVAGELDKNAKIYCAIYKVEKDAETEKEILKLMDVEIKDLVPGGENVAFTAIDKPDYEYVIKCFMIDINKLEAIIPAASN